MNVFHPSIIRRDKAHFLVAVPRFLCQLLNCAPSEDSPADVSAYFLDYSKCKDPELLHHLEPKGATKLVRKNPKEPPLAIPTASRCHLLILPYFSARIGSKEPLFHIHALMNNVPFSLFGLAWLLGDVFDLRLTYSYGIDAIENFGSLDAIVEPPNDGRGFKAGSINAVELEQQINDVIDGLATKPPNWKTFKRDLWRIYREATESDNSDYDTKNRVENAANKWMNVVQRESRDLSVRSIMVPPYLFPHPYRGDTPQSVLRPLLKGRISKDTIRTCLSFPKIRVRVSDPFSLKTLDVLQAQRAAVKARFSVRPGLRPLDAYWLELPHTMGALDLIAQYPEYFPGSDQPYSYAVVGLNEAAGSLAVHLKPNYEQLVDVSMRLTGDLASPGGLSRLSLAMSRAGWDIRIAAHRQTEADASGGNNETAAESLSIVADVSATSLQFFRHKECLCAAVRDAFVELNAPPRSLEVEATWACGCPPVSPHATVACACSGQVPPACDLPYQELCKRAAERIGSSGVVEETENVAEEREGTEDTKTTAWVCRNALCVQVIGGADKRYVVIETPAAEEAKQLAEAAEELKSSAPDLANRLHMLRVPLSVKTVSALAAAETPIHNTEFIASIVGHLTKDTIYSTDRPRLNATDGLEYNQRVPFLIANHDKPEFHLLCESEKARLSAGANGEVWKVYLPGSLQGEDAKQLATHPDGERLMEWTRKYKVHCVSDRDAESGEPWKPLVLKLALPHAGGDNVQATLKLPEDVSPPSVWVNRKGTKQEGVLMPFLDGDDLQQAFKPKAGYFGLEKIRRALIGIARGIDELWAKGFVNLDIKPANVFLTRADGVFLIDIGLCYQIDDTVKAVPTSAYLRDTKNKLYVFGSPYHIPPGVKEKQNLNDRTMTYQWGAVACALLGDTAFSRCLQRHEAGPRKGQSWAKEFETDPDEAANAYLAAVDDSKGPVRPSLPEWVRLVEPGLANLVGSCLGQEIRAGGFVDSVRQAVREVDVGAGGSAD